MKILVIGSGGREHAISWKIAQSNKVDNLYIAPGNAGTKQLGINVELDVNDFNSIKKLVLDKKIDMVIVGPEEPLVKGINNFFSTDQNLKNTALIGPNKEAAILESSKEYAKEFMMRHRIPTARYKSFTRDTIESGYNFLDELKAPYVIKADGLAAGKGVFILKDLSQAKIEFKNMLVNDKFGEASRKVLIEEFLEGNELSCFVLTDGKSHINLSNAKDYKRIGRADTGLNTGGMGAISPVPFICDAFTKKIEDQIILPTLKGLKKDGIDYRGFIFFGLIEVAGEPKLIEYNCRMGDPETEVIMPRLSSDLVELLEATANQTLSSKKVEFDLRSTATVFLVSSGYPGNYEKGKIIKGIEKVKDSILFHGGTKMNNNQIITSGGRVLAVTSYGDDFKKALDKSYENIEKISFDKMNFRDDIGFDL